MDFIRKEDGAASEATTWVCTVADNAKLLYYKEALDTAIERGVHIALHLESRSLLIHFPEVVLARDVRVKLQSILKKGGFQEVC